MSKSTAKQLGEHIAEMATGDRSRLVQRIQEVIIEDRKACGAAKDAQIVALREALKAAEPIVLSATNHCGDDNDEVFLILLQVRAAIEMSGGVL